MFVVKCDFCKKEIETSTHYRTVCVGYAVAYPHETENDFISKIGKKVNYHIHDECWDKIAEQLVGGI